jgi:hypothetical protein
MVLASWPLVMECSVSARRLPARSPHLLRQARQPSFKNGRQEPRTGHRRRPPANLSAVPVLVAVVAAGAACVRSLGSPLEGGSRAFANQAQPARELT